MTDAPYPELPHLTNSRQLIWDRTAEGKQPGMAIQELRRTLEALERRTRARRPDDDRNFGVALEAMSLDLFVAATKEPGRWLAYSRRGGDFHVPARYRREGITYTSATVVADLLCAAGFAEGTLGSYSRSDPFGGRGGGSGYRSRVIGTPALLQLFAAHGATPEQTGIIRGTEVVRLKGATREREASKPLLDYADTDETLRMRKGVHEWQEVAISAAIEVPPGHAADDPVGTTEDDAGDPEGERRANPADVLRPRLYRVFNNGSFDKGGRFYGGWWQSLPKRLRAGITISGEAVVELDFKSLHPRLCYDLESVGLGADVDVYDLGPRWSFLGRDPVKRAFAQLVAAGPETRIRKPDELSLPSGRTYPALLRELENRLTPIRPWLRKARSLDLQRIDADIAERVLNYLTLRGIVVLPVHDSFIVQRRHEVTLGQTMMLAYQATLRDKGRRPSVPVISGWSSSTTAETALLPFC